MNKNSGNGIATQYNVSNLLISHSSFYDNTSAIFIVSCHGNCLIENTTLANNSIYGLYTSISMSSDSSVNVRNSTFYMNNYNIRFYYWNGAGSTARLNIDNSIISKMSGINPNCTYIFPEGAGQISVSNSIVDDTTCGITSSIINADPQLQPLANNGGNTLTLLPLITSPAIDSGSNLTCSSTDQRNLLRPVAKVASATCDMGAVELH